MHKLYCLQRDAELLLPLGSTVKISSNTKLYENKKNWIDFNCGALVDGGSIRRWENLFLTMFWRLLRTSGQSRGSRIPRYGDFQTGCDSVTIDEYDFQKG
ncbi:MAG: hypothetical protein ACLTNW_18200 [Mediterraneibacter gnavus]